MSSMQCFLVCLLACVYLAQHCAAIGRNPTAVEHNACRVKWAEQVNEVKRVYKDERARVSAYNVSDTPSISLCSIRST